MQEKIITGKKHGLAVLLLEIVLFIAAFAGMIFGFVNGIGANDQVVNQPLFILGVVCSVLFCFFVDTIVGT